MITREYGEYYAVCDVCGEYSGPFFDFEDAVDSMKANGWRTTKTGAGWENYCPECARYTRPGPTEFAGINRPGY